MRRIPLGTSLLAIAALLLLLPGAAGTRSRAVLRYRDVAERPRKGF